MDDEMRRFKRLYYTLEQASKIKDKQPFFKITSKGSRALTELSMPKNEDEFGNFISHLYIIFYEGSGNGRRIPPKADNRDVFSKIKAYRTYYFHDIEHGKDKDIKRKYQGIRQINVSLIGKEVPTQEEDWNTLGIKLVEELSSLLSNLGKEEPPTETLAETLDIKEFSDDRITLFADKPVKFRKTAKYKEYSPLASAPIFLPTFHFTSPPQFGNTKSAIHVTSQSYGGSLKSFRKFMQEIRRLWLGEVFSKVLQIERLMPWSISNNDYMVYGSGVENLFAALRTYDLGVITMILQGHYGEDYTKSFFIIISSYRKGPVFRDNFIDFYLCNIPMNWDWINRINDSLDILSKMSNKATSYSLKPYYFYEWRSTSDISLKQVLGGIGRNGWGDERKHDVFEGLIVSREQAKTTYALDKEYSWIGDSKCSLPIDCLDEFVFSVTNRPPTQQEIKSGKLIGIRRPTVFMLVFDGYGHTIFALNGWGISKTQKMKNIDNSASF